MAFSTNDRVAETTTTTGTGTLNLTGAKTGFQTFVAGVGTSNTTYYVITDGTDWEVGIGTVTSGSPDTLSRDTVLASSNSGALVNWGSGTKDVFSGLPSSAINDVLTHTESTGSTARGFLVSDAQRSWVTRNIVEGSGISGITVTAGDGTTANPSIELGSGSQYLHVWFS